jgi:hypothetical protein
MNMESRDKKPSLKAQLLERLHDPFQMRIMVTALIVGLGYGAVYWPLSNDVAETQGRLAIAQKRLQLTKEIVALRTEFKRCQPRLSSKPETDEWIQHLLGGLRTMPVNLINMDFRPAREVGPYKAIVLRIQIEGTFQDLHNVLSWLETNERLYRVDNISLLPPQKGQGSNANYLLMELTLLGLMG